VGEDLQALRAEGRNLVGTREDSAVRAATTARSRSEVGRVSDSLRATTRAREISLATVRGISVIVVPASRADVVAEASSAIADVVLTTSGVGRSVDVVDVAKGVDTIALTNVVVVASNVEPVGALNVRDMDVAEVGRVEERAVKGTVVQSLSVGDGGLARSKEASVQGITNRGARGSAINRANLEEEGVNILDVVGHASKIEGVAREGGVGSEEPGARDGELEARRARIASIAIATVEVVPRHVVAGNVRLNSGRSGGISVRIDVVEGVEDLVIDATKEVVSASIGTTLLAAVSPVIVTIVAGGGVAVGVIEVNVAHVHRREVTRGNTAGVLDGIVVLGIGKDGDLTSALLNEDAVGLVVANSASGKSTRESVAVDAKISTAGSDVADPGRALSILNAVTNPDVAILRGSLLEQVSLATVTRIEISVSVAISAVHDAHTEGRGTPDTVAAKAEGVEGVNLREASQVATHVQVEVGVVSVVRVRVRDVGLNDVLIERRLLDVTTTSTEVLRVEEAVAVEREHNRVQAGNSLREVVVVAGVPEGPPDNRTLVVEVSIEVLIIGRSVGVVEPANGVTEERVRRGRVAGARRVVSGVIVTPRLDSDEGVAIVARNLAAVLPGDVGGVWREERTRSINALKSAIRRAVGVVLRAAGSGIASPADVAGMSEVLGGVRASEGSLVLVVVVLKGVNDARSSEGGDDTRELSAIVEVSIVALAVNDATAVSGVDVGIAAITEISVDLVAVAVEGVAESLIVRFRIEAITLGLRAKASVGDALSNSGARGRARAARLPSQGRRTASSNGGEVARIPVVESIAVLRVRAGLGVALANIDEERRLGREQKVLDTGVGRINEVRASVGTKGLLVHIGRSLSLLPGIERRRAATTEGSRLDDGTSADLVRITISDVVGVVGIPGKELRGSELINIVVLEVNEAINALSRARRPLSPSRELAVNLNTLKLVGAVNAGSHRVRADADFVEGGLDERKTTNVAELREEREVVLEVILRGEALSSDPERSNRVVRELRVPATVVGRGQRATETSLDRHVAEDVAAIHVPEVTAVVSASAHSPRGPGLDLSGSRLNLRVRPLLVDSSLAAVEEVAVLVSAAIIAGVNGLASVVGKVAANALPARGVAVLEEIELIAVNALRAAVALVTTDADAAVTSTVEVARLAREVAETLVGTIVADADTSGVLELRVELIVVRAVTSNNARLVVLPGERAVAVGVEPGENRVSELSRREVLGVNRAVVTVSLTAVLRAVIAVEPALLALVEAVAGPAELVGVVVDGVPEREVALEGVHLLTPADVDGVVVIAVAVNVDPGNAVDVLGPIATVALRRDGVSTEVDVVRKSDLRVLELTAIERGARVIVALPVLLIELTSEVAIEGQRETVLIELSLEAEAVPLGTGDDSTGTDADTTSPVTVARGRAGRPLRPSSDVAGNLGETNSHVRASAIRSASQEDAVGVNGRAAISSSVGSRNTRNGASRGELVTSPRELARIVHRAEGIRPESLASPVLRTPEEDLVDVEDVVLEVLVSVVNTNTESTTVLVISTKVGNELRNTEEASDLTSPGTIKDAVRVLVRVAVREAVEVLNEGQMADTTISSRLNNSTSANAGHEEVVDTDTVVLVRALAPVRPLREHAVNRVVVDLTEDRPVGSLGGLIDRGEAISSIVEESELTSSKLDRGLDLDAANSQRAVGEGRLRARDSQGVLVRTANNATNEEATSEGVLPEEATEGERASDRRGRRGRNTEEAGVVVDSAQDLDVVGNVVEEGRGSRVREGSEGLLVDVEAILIGVGDVGNEV